MDFSGLPKIELHLHLDCSLSYKVVKALKPQVSKEEYRKNYVAPSKCTNLLEYISCAASSIDIMQTEKELELVTLDLFEQLKADNVIYAEIRFAPLQHLQKGLSPNQVVEAVLRATEAGIKLKNIKELTLWDLILPPMKPVFRSITISKLLNMHGIMAFPVRHMPGKPVDRKVFGKH